LHCSTHAIKKRYLTFIISASLDDEMFTFRDYQNRARFRKLDHLQSGASHAGGLTAGAPD
jgi:hypothetical protein